MTPVLRSRGVLLTLSTVCIAVAASTGPIGSAVATDTTVPDPAAASGAYPVTIAHKYGETTVEDLPERIAVVGLLEQDALLALGVVPVATTEWFGEHPGAVWPWAADELEALGAEPPAVLGDPPRSTSRTSPPRIPTSSWPSTPGSPTRTTDCSRRSPRRSPSPATYIDYGIPWEELTRTVGLVVGQPDEAEALVADVEAQFASARDAYPEFVGATSVMATPYEGVWVYGPEDVRGRFLTNLGFELPANLPRSPAPSSAVISATSTSTSSTWM